jgi:hypothetical protein
MPQQSSKSVIQAYLLPAVAVVLILILVWVLLTQLGVFSVKIEQPGQDATGQTSMAPTPTPTPTELKQGKETYQYSWGQGTTIPKLMSIELDPHDPKVGQTQNVKTKMVHTSPLDSVSIILFSDNKETTYPLSLTEGSNTDGVWSGSWKINDTVLYRYGFRILSKTGGSEQKVDVVLRGSMP